LLLLLLPLLFLLPLLQLKLQVLLPQLLLGPGPTPGQQQH
jgi:hypothetical protein